MVIPRCRGASRTTAPDLRAWLWSVWDSCLTDRVEITQAETPHETLDDSSRCYADVCLYWLANQVSDPTLLHANSGLVPFFSWQQAQSVRHLCHAFKELYTRENLHPRRTCETPRSTCNSRQSGYGHCQDSSKAFYPHRLLGHLPDSQCGRTRCTSSMAAVHFHKSLQRICTHARLCCNSWNPHKNLWPNWLAHHSGDSCIVNS